MKYSKETGAFYAMDFDYQKLPDDLIDVSQADFERAVDLRGRGGVLDVVNGVLVMIEPAPSPAHDWDAKKQEWLLNKIKQSELDAAALAAAKSAALAAAVHYADELQASILGETSPAAQARLMSKYTAAVAIKSGADTAGDHAVIDAEVQLRSKYTKAKLVDVIVSKGTAAKMAEGMINGMLLLAQDAFEPAQTIEELGERVEAITAQADALKSKLLAAMGGALKSKLLAAMGGAA